MERIHTDTGDCPRVWDAPKLVYGGRSEYKSWIQHEFILLVGGKVEDTG